MRLAVRHNDGNNRDITGDPANAGDATCRGKTRTAAGTTKTRNLIRETNP